MSIDIKFCGFTNYQDTLNAINLRTKYLGFNFYPMSKRYITSDNFQIIISKAEILKKRNDFKTVAIMVNPNKTEVEEILKTNQIDILQFHGNEKPEFCQQFADQIEVWKAIELSQKDTLNEVESKLKKYNFCQQFVLDAVKKDDDSQLFKREDIFLKLKSSGFPLILAGGLKPENLDKYIQKIRPEIIDIASGIEDLPGKKSYTKMESIHNIVNKQRI